MYTNDLLSRCYLVYIIYDIILISYCRYDGKHHRPMSKEKAEREKLLHKCKREFKGAIREIRRDRNFLAKVQIAQQIKSDAERKRRVNEIFGDAAVQQNEIKKMRKKK